MLKPDELLPVSHKPRLVVVLVVTLSKPNVDERLPVPVLALVSHVFTFII